MKPNPRKKLEASSWFAVVRCYQECTRRYARLMQGFDLTIPQFDVLTAIHKLGAEATPKAIADELLVTRGNITGVLHRLQDHGLLSTRVNEQDGRSFVCELTDQGRTLFRQARLAASLFIDRQLAPFSDEELRESEEQMNRMYRHLHTIEPEHLAERVLLGGDRPAADGGAS